MVTDKQIGRRQYRDGTYGAWYPRKTVTAFVRRLLTRDEVHATAVGFRLEKDAVEDVREAAERMIGERRR